MGYGFKLVFQKVSIEIVARFDCKRFINRHRYSGYMGGGSKLSTGDFEWVYERVYGLVMSRSDTIFKMGDRV